MNNHSIIGAGYAMSQQAKQRDVLAEQSQLRREPEPYRGEYQECREQAHMAMNALAECITELERRLNPVLRPIPTAAGAGQNQTMPALAPVSEALFSISNHASELRARVVALVEALAV